MRKEQMVASRLPEEVIHDLEMIESVEQTDRSTTVRKLLYRAIADWKREHFARQYGEGRMTLARGAEEAGVSLWEMLDYARRRKIASQYDLDDLKKDVEAVLGGGGPGRRARSGLH